jgi:hypothetical protein
MASKADFTPEEWTRVAASPMVAGMAITAAEPSGLWGLLKESMSSGWSLVEAKQNAGANPLVKAVADDIANAETRDGIRHAFQDRFKSSQLADIKQKSIAELRDVSAILDAKAPGDAASFKSWLREVAQKTAEAGSEGGFLGFGGVQVSDAEKATLAEISMALGAPDPNAAGANQI